MKYILEKGYMLRGFSGGKSRHLINREKELNTSLHPMMAQMLSFCDGEIDFDNPLISVNLRNLAVIAVKKGWVREAQDGETLEEYQKLQNLSTPGFSVVQWSITGKCNARCRHCFIAAPDKVHNDLTTEEMIKILDELEKNFVSRISITGGEPLCRKDLPVLLDEMEKRHIKVTAISTNGFLLNEKMVELFEQHGMKPKVQISFDGVGHHDWLRRVKGAEEMAINSAKSCIAHGWQVTLAMCIHHGNLESLHDTAKLAAELGCETLRICPVSGFNAAKNEGVETYNSEEMYNIYINYIPTFIREKLNLTLSIQGVADINGLHPEKFRIIPLIHTCTDIEKNRVCESVDNSFYISETGEMMPCFTLAESGKDGCFLTLHDHTLKECTECDAYREFISLSAKDLLDRNPECRECPYVSQCGLGCRAASQIEDGDYYGIDHDRCRFFKEQWPEKFTEAIRNAIEQNT